MPRRTAYFREYIRAKKRERRQQLIDLLGGCCSRCGSVERLEFDHVDPAGKNFNIGGNLTKAWDELVAEAQLCQLLCRPCHVAKGQKTGPNLLTVGIAISTTAAAVRCAELPTPLRAPGRGLGG